ncbi:glycosyltransferase [Pleionea sediminis]|uniref:glycosyltransferase n=1 Tax=Pleionea sediminis TaxID=2569479 RepID=UPI0011870A6E|nr:glycosyltransferase [Pleionea sediminis]
MGTFEAMSSKKLTVVHVVSGDLWAGAEVQVYTLLTALHSLQSITAKAIVLNQGTLANRLKKAGIEVEVIEESKNSTLEIYKKVKNTLTHWKPDVVHTHREKENIIGSFAAKAINALSVRTMHGAPEHKFNWKKPHKLIIRALDRFCAKQIQQKCISVSTELATYAKKFAGEKHVVTIENAIDATELKKYVSETNDKLISQPIKLGIVGRLVPIKRIDRCINAIKSLIDKGYPVQCEIIGDGPLRSTLELLVKEKKMSHNIFFRGHCENVHRLIANLDALIICSDHEGLPMVLLEAMYLGVPVIASAVGAIPSVLSDGACGELVEDLTETGFSIALGKVIESPEKSRHKAQLAHARIVKHYSAEDNARKYVSLYRSLGQPRVQDNCELNRQ